jgi:hypothetical protein
MNSWLAAAPKSSVAHGEMGCALSVNDLADRMPRPLTDGQVLDLGERRIETPHVPHGWDAGVMYEETAGTLLCEDLFTVIGDGPAITDHEIVGPALRAEDIFGATCLTPSTAPAMRTLAALAPVSLGLMHGPAYTGDCTQALFDPNTDIDKTLSTLSDLIRSGKGARNRFVDVPRRVDRRRNG